MESENLTLGKDSSNVAHHRRLVQSRLSVHDQHISILKMAVDDLAADLDLVRNTVSFLL